MKTIETQISEMLTENTGRNFLDSGDHYGRNYEKNQGRNFEDEPEITLDYYDGKLETFTVSLFHYLTQSLQVNDTSEMLTDIIQNQLNGEIFWVQDALDFIDSELPADSIEIVTPVFNTYNYEDNLSQVFIGSHIRYDDEIYTIIQIHGGCDVRGGYTLPRVFQGQIFGNPNVYGVVTKKDGSEIQIDTMYNGYSLTDEGGQEVEILETDEIELSFIPHDDDLY
jgi:hypothetical protein